MGCGKEEEEDEGGFGDKPAAVGRGRLGYIARLKVGGGNCTERRACVERGGGGVRARVQTQAAAAARTWTALAWVLTRA